MISISAIKKRLRDLILGKKVMDASCAYDLWSVTYDKQTNNPIMFLDDILFNEMISNIKFGNKTVVDIGCGTGRQWELLLAKNPLEIIGYDVSKEMLNKLHQKFPEAKAYLMYNKDLKELKDASCDLIICNLVIGYIKDLPKTFIEWNRILKKNGEIIITDFHPAALRKGASRSFRNKQEVIYIRNYSHPLKRIKKITKKLGWHEINLFEKKVDETIKHFFEENNSVQVYEKNFNTPILYGYHFKRI